MIALLPALDALLGEASVTRAAERLHVSPPAMSRTLTRLRELLQDPLLVRAGRGLVLTARGAALKPEVRQLVEQATQLLSRDETRLADVQTRVLTIRADDGVAALLGAQLLARARSKAPGLVLRFVAEAEDDLGDLRHGRVDLDIGLVTGEQGELESEALFEDEWVLLMRRRNRLAVGALTLKRLAAAEHVLASRKGRLASPLDAVLREHGYARRTRLVVPTHLAGAAVVAHGDAVMLAPASLARGLAALMDLRSRPLPMDWPRARIAMIWHPRLSRDVTHTWLRAQVSDIARELVA
jgi:DNA-binding transcriptional LysR family regulator